MSYSLPVFCITSPDRQHKLVSLQQTALKGQLFLIKTLKIVNLPEAAILNEVPRNPCAGIQVQEQDRSFRQQPMDTILMAGWEQRLSDPADRGDWGSIML